MLFLMLTTMGLFIFVSSMSVLLITAVSNYRFAEWIFYPSICLVLPSFGLLVGLLIRIGN